MYDGSALFVNTFDERIRPYGCEIKVFESGFAGFARGLRGFIWQPNRMILVPADVAEMRGMITSSNLVGDDIELVFVSSESEVKLTLLAKSTSGFNVSYVRASSADDETIYAEHELEWTSTANGYYPSKIVRQEYTDGRLSLREIVEIKDFRRVATEDSSLFEYDALEPCKSRVIDSRGPTKIYKDPSNNITDTSRIEDMVQQLEASEAIDVNRDPVSGSNRRTAFLFGVLLIALILSCFWWKVRD